MMENPNIIRFHLDGLKPYEPIDPPEVLGARVGVPPEKVIKLDGNENPYGCSPRVQRALGEAISYNIYPDPLNREVRQLLEGYTGFGSEYIAVGSGSDELIDNILRISLEPGDKVINCPPTFGMYPFSTQVNGGEIVNIERKPDYSIDVDAIESAIDSRTKVVFITSPNNPTGNLASEGEIIQLLKTNIWIVVDEAYYEFAKESVAQLVRSYSNLIVLRTFSKWAGLAGLRVGYGILSPEINEIIYRMKMPYNVTIAAQIAVRETFTDMEYIQSTIEAIITERQRLFDKLKEQGILDPIPSRSNFILCRVLKSNARQIKQDLENKGIFIRYFDNPLLDNMIRISVGKPEHTDAIIEALAEVR
ncbi:MAG: histidinol-phosphate transaminase [Chloroflexi bacterium]|nr:histidinol-phosphate transaminase [Chloroflexota bacterium]